MDNYYIQIARKLDQHAAGAPKKNGDFSPAFIEYLKLLYSPEQAKLARHMIRFGPLKTGNPLSPLMYALPIYPSLLNVHQFYETAGPEEIRAAVLPSNFVPQPDEKCIHCGACVKKCPLGAITVDKHEKQFLLDESKCVGCGVCTTACRQQALKLIRKERATPRDDAADLYHTIDVENQEKTSNNNL